VSAGPFPTDGHGDIVYVEYIDDVPHSVVTTDDTFDFESVRGRVMFHRSGSGWHRNHPDLMLPAWIDPSDTSWWVAECVVLSVWDADAQATRPATAEEIAACGSLRLAELPSDPFDEADEAEAGFQHCGVCEDVYDRDDTCGHVFYGEHWWTGPGYTDGSGPPGADCMESFLALCRRAGIVRALRHGLVPFAWKHSECHATGGLGPSFVWFTSDGKYLGNIAEKLHNDSDPDRFRSGAGWLMALDKKTLAANEQTKRWLDEEVARQDARRASGAVVYIVCGGYGAYVTDEAHSRWLDHDQHWTNDRHAVDHARRMPWSEALRVAKIIRTAGGESSIIYRPACIANAANVAMLCASTEA